MNHATSLRYIHTDSARMPRDMRRESTPEISLEQYYFVGYRIDTANAYRYHHALLLADSHDALIEGIKAENATIAARHAIPVNNIAPVFVRNLMMLDPASIQSADSHQIREDIQAGLARRDDNQFMVFGMAGEQRVLLNTESTQDALLAIWLTRWKCAMRLAKDFRTMEVCQAHPVTREFDALFHETAKRVKQLARSQLAEGSLLH